MKQLEVFPECFLDTNFVSYMLGGWVKHKHSCNEVANAINKTNGFAIGIIDDDKREPKLDNGFELYEYHTKHISMFVHQDGHRYLFKVKKAMDSFIYDMAKDEKVQLSQFNLPNDFKDFKKVTKQVQANKDERLIHLFEQLKNNREFVCFRNTLKYLVSKQLKADINTAKKFFKGTLTKDDLARILY